MKDLYQRRHNVSVAALFSLLCSHSSAEMTIIVQLPSYMRSTVRLGADFCAFKKNNQTTTLLPQGGMGLLLMSPIGCCVLQADRVLLACQKDISWSLQVEYCCILAKIQFHKMSYCRRHSSSHIDRSLLQKLMSLIYPNDQQLISLLFTNVVYHFPWRVL